MTETSTRPSIWKRIVQLPGLPIRLFQERTSVQLIVSHVAVVLMSLFLIYVALIASIVGPIPFTNIPGINQLAIDPFLGEQARGYAQWMQPDRLKPVLDDGIDQDESEALNLFMATIIDGKVPGFESNGLGEGVRWIEYAAIVDADGFIIATSDPEWAATGARANVFPRLATDQVTEDVLEDRGDINNATGKLYGLTISEQRTSAAYPLITSNGEFLGALVCEGSDISTILGTTRSGVIRELAGDYLRQLWIITIPALLVAIPVGVWRSRTLSRRLRRLEGAAGSMASGNLQTRVLVTRRDEIGRLAERFNEMGERIEATDRGRRAFVSNVSHELRTPVAIIAGATERLIDQQERNEPIDTNALDVVKRETDMLTRLIDDLFTLTRIEEHNLRLEREDFNPAAVAREAVRSMGDLAWSQRKVRVESLVSPDLAPVRADRTRVRQIINNLLYNALRHTPEGGLIVVQARQIPDFIELSISDTGMGIPDRELQSVFERFYQSERSERSSEGSGLGLSIVRQLVEAHGGVISAESIVGQGTTFRFTLPIAK
jgi:two-component system sensor histidine kinase BaeS